ncbi:MAG: amidohydrolase family protein, partial [Candidatus Sumerlaeaceae bacterium]|nr:amidohydrolase family protein [Candidatus Sumerlaeaceae bacterium]
VTDRHGLEGAKKGIEENADFLMRGQKAGWYGGMVGAHASFTLSDGTLNQLAELSAATQVGVHIHCAEAESDNDDALKRCGRRALGRLAENGILRPGTILVHCTHLTQEEIHKAYDAGCWIVHNPRSNMNNSVGYTCIEELARGRLALGTDGIDADLITESKVAFFKARDARAELPFDAPLRWLAGAAQLATESLGVPLGRLMEGSPADLVLVEYPQATPLTEDNLAGHWFFGLSPAHIHSVMVGGRWLVRNRRLADDKLYEELENARVVAAKVWQRVEKL